jgi:tetratricopeptide (TPR) repeat protein
MKIPRATAALLVLLGTPFGCALAPSVHYPLTRDYVESTKVLAGSLAVQGMQEYQSGRLIGALQRFQEAEALLQPSPGVALRRNLSIVFLRAGFPEESLRYVSALRKELPDSVQLMFDEANARAEAKEFDKAIKLYKEALKEALLLEDPTLPSGIARSLARAYFEIGDEKEAACYAWLAFSINPVLTAVTPFAEMMIATGGYQKLITQFETLYPAPKYGGSAEVVWALALSYLGLGNDEQYKILQARARELLTPEQTLESDILAMNQLLYGKEEGVILSYMPPTKRSEEKRQDNVKSADDEVEEGDDEAIEDTELERKEALEELLSNKDIVLEDPRDSLQHVNPLSVPPAIALLLVDEAVTEEPDEE